MEETAPTTSSPAGTPVSVPAPIKKVPPFLLVICILTFVGSGLGILGSLFSLATANLVAANNEQIQEQLDDQDNSPSFFKNLLQSAAKDATPETIRTKALLSIVSCVFTLFGAIFMLRLKKWGFYLYLAGTVLYVFLPLISANKFFGIAGMLFSLMIGGGFIAMYAVNLKHMNKPAN